MADRNYQQNREYAGERSQGRGQSGYREDRFESQGGRQEAEDRGRYSRARDFDDRNEWRGGGRQGWQDEDFERGGGGYRAGDFEGRGQRGDWGGSREGQRGGFGGGRASYSSEWEQDRGGDVGRAGQMGDRYRAGGSYQRGSYQGGGDSWGDMSGDFGGGRHGQGAGWDRPSRGGSFGGMAGGGMGRDQERYRVGMDDGSEGRYGQSNRGRGPRNYQRSDDRIREDVCDRLSDDDHVDASDIEVSVSDREVTLSGEVDSKQAKRHAEDCADSVSGVEHVQNNLRVKKRGGNDDSETTKSKRKE